MTFLNKVKPNKPTVNLDGYLITLHGKSKFGKTTFVVDLIQEAYDGDLSKALLIGCEVGYRALSGVYAVPISDFKESEKDYDEDSNIIIDENTTYGFVETVDELVENKKELPYKLVIIDTITALERYAKESVISSRRISDGKMYKKIGDIPYGVGYEEVADVIYEQIDRLIKCGYGVIIIGHTKTQKIKNKNGFEYDYANLNALGKVVDVIEKESDFIIYGDLEVVKKGIDGVEEVRTLRFRTDGNHLCGTRFRQFPDSLELNPKLFLDEFKKAVLGLYNGDEEAVEEQKKAEEKSKDKIKKEVSVDDLKKEISNIIKDKNKDEKLEIAKEFASILGDANFKASDDKSGLRKALTYLKNK